MSVNVMIALGHIFLMSLASGVVIGTALIYSETSIVQTSLWMAVIDTIVALLAGLAISPGFGFGLTPVKGQVLSLHYLWRLEMLRGRYLALSLSCWS